MPAIIDPEMESLAALLQSKAKQIDLDERRQDLELAQQELERFLNLNQGRVTAVSDKVLTVTVNSSVIASDLRFSQTKLLESVSRALKRQILRLYIRIG